MRRTVLKCCAYKKKCANFVDYYSLDNRAIGHIYCAYDGREFSTHVYVYAEDYSTCREVQVISEHNNFESAEEAIILEFASRGYSNKMSAVLKAKALK